MPRSFRLLVDLSLFGGRALTGWTRVSLSSVRPSGWVGWREVVCNRLALQEACFSCINLAAAGRLRSRDRGRGGGCQDRERRFGQAGLHMQPDSLDARDCANQYLAKICIFYKKNPFFFFFLLVGTDRVRH